MWVLYLHIYGVMGQGKTSLQTIKHTSLFKAYQPAPATTSATSCCLDFHFCLSFHPCFKLDFFLHLHILHPSIDSQQCLY